MIYTSNYTKDEIDAGVGLGLASPKNIYDAVRLMAGLQYGGYTVTETTNAEWKYVLTDLNGKVVAGIRQDDSLFIAELS